MNILCVAEFIIFVDEDRSPKIRSDVNKITICCTSCMYCVGKVDQNFVQFDWLTEKRNAKLRQAQILALNKGNGMLWWLKGRSYRESAKEEM